MCREVGVNLMPPRGLRHVALSISFLSPMARRPDASFAMNIASLILRPDLGFLALTSFRSFNPPQFELWKLLPDVPCGGNLYRFRARACALRENIHTPSRFRLTRSTRPRFAATSFEDFAIPISTTCHR
jgi:hypothetical protein